MSRSLRGHELMGPGNSCGLDIHQGWPSVWCVLCVNLLFQALRMEHWTFSFFISLVSAGLPCVSGSCSS